MKANTSKDFVAEARVFTGRDKSRNDAVAQAVAGRIETKGRPAHDSVVIAGNGIGSLTFASRLARSPEFAGRVTIIAPTIQESRRLINGVSLRGHAADYLSYALDCTHGDLLEAFAAGKRPVCYRQTTSMAARDASGKWKFAKPGAWQGGNRGSDRPLIYGVRNTRVTAGMQELMSHLDITFVEEKVVSTDHMRDLAKGSNPLLVNATTNPRLLGAEAEKPTRLVLAVQAPFKVKPGRLDGPLETGTAYAPLVRRSGIVNVGYFTPFADPLSPDSSWYGVIARVVDANSGFDKESELEILTNELLSLADGMGLDVDDPDETLAKALVPASPFGKIAPSAPGTLELKRAYSGGNPCYYADGMASAAIGGTIAAEALIAGVEIDSVVRRSLADMRWDNRLFWIETTRIAAISDFLVRLSARGAMVYPHSTAINRWRAAA